MGMGPLPRKSSEHAKRMWRLADELGWEVLRATRGGAHYLLWHPVTGATAMISLNLDGKARAYRNTESQIRRGARG